jgi:anhydro-N-acetylmuramic acid kinase
MSGTSMDGLDITLCDITGAGLATKVNVLQFTTLPYDEFMKEQILSVFSKEMVSLEKLTLLNAWIASEHAQMINTTLAGWGISADTIDLIASHGQTIYHAPKSLHPNDIFGNATLQIGDGDHIAVQTGIITLSDFRQKHIAAGGAGAPLALYGDYLLCGDAQENRLLLNMGGISNYTYLPANATLEMVCSTDTGPGNTIMDAYMRLYYNQAFDKDGVVAQQGTANTHLLNKLLEDTFFSLYIPKTIGPELFNIEYVQKAISACGVDGISIPDIMATLALFTATTIVDTIYKLVPANENFTIYTSGGGMHNPVIMQHLKNLMPTIQILSSEIIGIDPNAKEAILFAVLANEAVAGEAMYAGNNSTKVPVSMGKISFPH